jgi:hypothetical protein
MLAAMATRLTAEAKPGCVSAIQREASDATAFRLALVENLHREGLSHQEQVEALDMLATMVDGQGLPYTAAELGISRGWLSRRLSMRRDPNCVPALEEGRITFIQATSCWRRLPPHGARCSIACCARAQGGFDELRAWVQASREQLRQGQQCVVDQLAAEPTSEPEPRPAAPATYARAREMVRDLTLPATPEETTALGDLVVRLQERWELVRPRRSRRPSSASRPCSADRPEPADLEHPSPQHPRRRSPGVPHGQQRPYRRRRGTSCAW